MQSQQPPNQPLITDQFIVKVKLLSNQVYEFPIDPQTTKVSDLKRMILDKINIPLDKQRIIFGAKQLLDDSKVTQYVKESGLTVHLIARIGAQQNTTQNNNNTQSTTQQQQQQQQQQQNIPQQQPQTNPQSTQPPNPFENILRGMGLAGNMPQTTSVTINAGDLGSSLNGLLGSFGIRLPTQPPMPPQQRPPQQQNTHNNPFQTPPTNTQRQNPPPQQPTSSFNLNQPQQQQVPSNNQPQQNTQFNVSNEPILRLNQTITTLNLPAQPVLSNQQMSLREQTAQYLRRLQHQYMRMIPQLNRTVQLLNEGRVSHLGQILRLFQAVDAANHHAQESMRRLINLPANQAQSQQPQSFFSQVPSSLINQPNNLIQGVQIQLQEGNQQMGMNDGINNIQTTTIIIQDNQIDDSIDEEPTVFPNQTQSSQQNMTSQIPQTFSSTINLGNLGGFSSLLQGLSGQPIIQGQGNQQSAQQQPNMMMGGLNIGGLNIGGLMSMLGGTGMNPPQQRQQNQPPQNAQQTQSSTQPNASQQTTQQPQQVPHVHGPGCNHQHQPQQQQAPQQLPQFDMSNLASMASMLFNPQQQQPQQSSNQPQQQQNPMGGLMGMFSSLQQSGGMGELLNTSLGETLEEGLTEPTVYSAILKSFTGSDILTCFTSKNFEFLDRKYDLVRSNFLNAIAIAGSQEQLVEKVSTDIANLLIPRNNVNDYENCLQQVRAVTHRHVSEIVGVTMDRGDTRYSERMTGSLKKAFCEAIEKVVSLVNPQTLANGQSTTQLVFENLKVNSIQLMDEFIQGLSGMFYGFIERDLIRIYNEYREDQKRKQQRSNEQIASEEELLKQIEIESKKDIDYLKNFKHSEFYLPKNE